LQHACPRCTHARCEPGLCSRLASDDWEGAEKGAGEEGAAEEGGGGEEGAT